VVVRWKAADTGEEMMLLQIGNKIYAKCISFGPRARIKESKLVMWGFVMEVAIVSAADNDDSLGY
jgi:hypothetical protein